MNETTTITFPDLLAILGLTATMGSAAKAAETLRTAMLNINNE